jgi:uncharacterized protein (DUF433 family)
VSPDLPIEKDCSVQRRQNRTSAHCPARGVCGGEPVIDGLRVSVHYVATLHLRGETIPESIEALGLTEAQVCHALSYLFDHHDEITALMAQAEQTHVDLSGP